MAALLSVNNIKLTPDSFEYGMVSQQIIAGNGIRVPLIWLESHLEPINGTVPFLLHPPLLPLLLAVLGGVTPHHYLAAQLLNVVCYVIISIFTYFLVKRISTRWLGMLAAVLVAVSFPMLRVNHFIWTEVLFISLTTATIFFVTGSRDSDHGNVNARLILGSICASAAIMSRYVGVALIPIFIWEVVVLIKNKRVTSKYISSIVSIILPVVTAAALFIRNYLFSGLLRGIDLPEVERSFLSAFKGTAKMIFSQFDLGNRSAAVIIAFALLFLVYVYFNKELRREMSKLFFSGLDVIIIYVLSYTGLIFISMVYKQPNFEVRFMSPLVPYLYILVIVSLYFIWNSLRFRVSSKVLSGGIMLFLCILTVGTLYKTYLQLPYFFDNKDRNYSFLNSCTYKWIAQNYKKDVAIATNEPFRLSFFGGYFVIKLPSSNWDKFTKIPENMDSLLPERMSVLGARSLALFNEIKGEHYGQYLAGLYMNREDHDKFLLVNECEDGVVYELKNGSELQKGNK